MTTLFDQAKRGDFILREVEPTISRDVVTVTGAEFFPGSVLSLDGDGKYGVLDASETSTIATSPATAGIAVLYDHVDASEADKSALVITRLCSLKANHLAWPESISETDKALALSFMADKLLIVKGA